MFWKCAANLQANTHPEVRFQWLQSNFIEITLRHGCSPVKLLHILRTPFPMKNSGWLLLINETDTKLREYYEGKELIFVDKSNINESCLNNSKLYLNKKSSNMLSSNIKKLLCQVWCSQTRTHNIDIINQTLIKNNDIDKLLLNFRRNTSSNLAFVSLNINSKGTIDDLRKLVY